MCKTTERFNTLHIYVLMSLDSIESLLKNHSKVYVHYVENTDIIKISTTLPGPCMMNEVHLGHLEDLKQQAKALYAG